MYLAPAPSPERKWLTPPRTGQAPEGIVSSSCTSTEPTISKRSAQIDSGPVYHRRPLGFPGCSIAEDGNGSTSRRSEEPRNRAGQQRNPPATCLTDVLL